MFLHDSHDAFFRTPAGPAPAGSEITVRFLSDESESVTLRTWCGEEKLIPMTFAGEKTWSAQITAPEEPGWLWYDFVLHQKNGKTLRYGNAFDQLGGKGEVYETGAVSSYQITVYKPSFKTPGFFQGANIYQIFPDRFFRAPTKAKDTRTDRHVHENWDEDLLPETDPRGGKYMELDFYGGTLTGIMKKLPYLEKMGVTVLYLNPIFRARSNHRYDTGDYMEIDPLVGTQEEFEALCKKAEERGIRVMLDGVFSHTGEDSRYFNHFGTYDTVGAYQSKESPWYDWYTFKHFPDEYKCWWDITSLPEVRKDNADYQQFMFKPKEGVVPHWIHAGRQRLAAGRGRRAVHGFPAQAARGRQACPPGRGGAGRGLGGREQQGRLRRDAQLLHRRYAGQRDETIPCGRRSCPLRRARATRRHWCGWCGTRRRYIPRSSVMR